MGVFTWIIQGLQAMRSWFFTFEYDGIPLYTVVLFVFFGVCICRFILPFFIPQFNWRSSGSDTVRSRNK